MTKAQILKVLNGIVKLSKETTPLEVFTILAGMPMEDITSLVNFCDSVTHIMNLLEESTDEKTPSLN